MTDTSLTPAREQEIRTMDLLELMSDRAAPVISGHLAALLAEVDRLRAALSDAADQVVERDNELGGVHVELAGRPAEAHVLRQAAAQVEDDHPEAAATLYKAANVAEHAAAQRPWQATRLAENLAGLDAMRADHPAPCRVPDSPDCTCPAECQDCGAPKPVTGSRTWHRIGCPQRSTR